MKLYLISLRMNDDTFYRTVYGEALINSPEMQHLRALAHLKGFRVDQELLDNFEDIERSLQQLDVGSSPSSPHCTCGFSNAPLELHDNNCALRRR